MDACTIIAKNYLAQARVLANSFQEHHPDNQFFVLVIDRFDGYFDPRDEPFAVVTPDQLDLDAFEEMATIYDVTELSTSVKPWLLRYLLNERVKGPVAYLDPDIKIFSNLNEVDRLVRAHGLVLTPHTTEPLPQDGKQPSEIEILASGTYNLGFIALDPRDEIHALLDWWSERLRYDCVIDHALGYFVDQRWFDMTPGMLSDFCVLGDPGYNVAYWNLPNRRVERNEDSYTVNGAPLRFFHYSGFDPEQPHLMSKHQNRLKLSKDPVLAELFASYSEELRAAGHELASRWPYTYATAADGTRLTPLLRRIYRNGARAGALTGSVFTKAGQDEFERWLREPARKGAHAGINRFLEEVYRARPDLQEAYPDLDSDDAAGFAGWAHVYGHEVSMPEALLPPVPKHLEHELAAERDSRERLREFGSESAPLEPWGVNVVGYLRSELGVGEAARLAISALDTARIASMPVHGRLIPSSRQGHDYAHVDSAAAPFPVNLLCINADGLPNFVHDAGPEFFEGRYQIGMWWWEVHRFPEQWLPSFQLLDEVWVGTQHIADALTPVSPIPVVQIRLPVTVPEIAPRSRSDLGLPEGFVFLFLFDFHSVLERKNPVGLIEAFKTAFAPGSGASLVIKSINSEYHPDKHELLVMAAAGHPDIHIVDRYVSVQDKNAMLASADCYVSLHRSEGFGLPLAESMYLGKPVIATAYSGNLDFMTPRNSYLVNWAEQIIGENCYPYPADGTWADPDIDDAARLMRNVFEDPDEARRRGELGARDIRRSHSPEAAGETVATRLEHVRQRMVQGEARSSPARLPVRQIPPPRDRIYVGPVSPSRTRFGPFGKLARRLVLRLIKPYSMHQRDVLLEMDARLQQLERDSGTRHAEVLSQARAERAQLQDLQARMEKADRLVAQSHARPAAEFLPFGPFQAPSVGQVYGYRTLEGEAESEDRYREFAEVFRGSEAKISERQRCYVPLIAGHDPVLDVGCGRGEFLDLLREQGTRYAGIDLDRGMVERCKEKGHDNVMLSGANEHLERLPDESQGVIFSAQVIEHMQHDYLQRFLQLAARKLKPDGLLIAETVNPHSVQAMKAFWLDLTHEQPIFPEVALALCRATGFGSAYVFHPNGSGSAELDRFVEGDYALVATASGTSSAVPVANHDATDDGYVDGDASANASAELAVRRSQRSG